MKSKVWKLKLTLSLKFHKQSEEKHFSLKRVRNTYSEKLVKSMADVLSGQEYRSAGFEYLSLGDCWMARTRDTQGRLQPDKSRFPNGMAALADYVIMEFYACRRKHF